MNKIILTGSSGFVGSRFLLKSKYAEICEPVSLQHTDIENVDFTGIEKVIHCAGIAHQMEKIDDSLFYSINRDLTIRFAEKAKQNGVGIFVFLSTVKVYGLDCHTGTIHGGIQCKPNDSYGKSKWGAEIELKKMETNHFKIAIIRPPLIYGPGVKGNLDKLMRVISKSRYLPLGGINNRRSILFVDNLVNRIDNILDENISLTITPVDKPAVSTTYLVEHLSKVLNPKRKIFSIPKFLRFFIKNLRPETFNRLFGSLEFSISDINEKNILKQKVSIEEGLKIMAEDFKNKKN